MTDAETTSRLLGWLSYDDGCRDHIMPIRWIVIWWRMQRPHHAY